MGLCSHSGVHVHVYVEGNMLRGKGLNVGHTRFIGCDVSAVMSFVVGSGVNECFFKLEI